MTYLFPKWYTARVDVQTLERRVEELDGARGVAVRASEEHGHAELLVDLQRGATSVVGGIVAKKHCVSMPMTFIGLDYLNQVAQEDAHNAGVGVGLHEAEEDSATAV